MATYTFSALSDGAAIAFDPEQDDLVFDQATISAADLDVSGEGSDVRLLVARGAEAGKSIVLQGVSPLQLATSNVQFANGSQLLFGDDSVAQNDDGANVLNGTGGNDLLEGFGGADRINAGSGNDRVFGGAGNDFASGNGGVDWVSGGAGNDTIAGGGGQDSFAFHEAGAANADSVSDFSSGWDSLHFDAAAFNALGAEGQLAAGDGRFRSGAGITSGQDADDRLIYDTSTGQLFYDADGSGAGAAQLIATLNGAPSVAATDLHVFDSGSGGDPGDGVIRGTEGDDVLLGTDGEDRMEGLGGNDTLDGLAGADTMTGGPGSDVYVVDDFGDVVIEEEGGGSFDEVRAFISYTLPSWVNNLTLLDSVETAGIGNELGNVIVNAGHAEAFLNGQGGNDTLIGGSGFDFFTLSAGSDVVDGGAGFDWLDNGSVDFRMGVASTEGGTTSFSNVEAALGSAGGDAMVADDVGRWLRGRAGDDTLTGGAGDDELLGDAGFDHPDVDTGADVLRGGAGNDMLAGGNGSDTLDGGTGNDTLNGSSSTGDDFSDGRDRFFFTVAPGDGNADVARNFESSEDEVVLGADAMPALGAGGQFSAGDARFFAGAGANSGQDASDRVVYNTTTGQLWYDADGSGGAAALLIATLQGAPALAATDIEVIGATEPPPGGIVGTEGNDTLTGTGGDDEIHGLGGNDAIQAQAGNDRVFGGAGNDVFSGNAGVDWVDGGTGNDTVSGGGGQDSFAFSAFGAGNADQLNDFSSGWDSLHFDADAFTALGAEGQFSAGDGRFRSGAGLTSGQDADDRLVYDTTTRQLWYDADGSGAASAQVVATLQSGATLAATDLHVFVGGGAEPGGDQHLVGTSGNDTLEGGPGNDTLEGLAGDDTLRGREGNDVLEGGEGVDFLDGGAGDDTYRVRQDFDAEDVIVDASGIDTVISLGFFVLGEGIENLELFNGPGDDGATGIGNDLDNTITARGGSFGGNIVDGAGGDDTLVGEGLGNDVFLFQAGSGDYGHDTILAGDGFDRVSFYDPIRNVSYSASAVIIDLRAGTLSGGGLGGAGSATLSGVENAAGGGFDDLLIAHDGILVEDIFGGPRLEGAVLNGHEGQDTLVGGADNDTLMGGSGDDTFRFEQEPGESGADDIRDFVSGEDRIALDATVMDELGATGAFAADDPRFHAAAGANAGHDSDDRVVYDTITGELWYDADGSGTAEAQLIATLVHWDGSSYVPSPLSATDITVLNGDGGLHRMGTSGNDTLLGGPGNDTLEGFAGDDTLRGLEGNDVLDGGEGVDLLDGGLGDDTYIGAGYQVFPEDSIVDADGIDTAIALDTTAAHLHDGLENLIYRVAAPAEDVAQGNAADNLIVMETGPGHLFVYGREGDDTLLGGQAGETFVFAAGEGNDVVDGGGSTTDVILFEDQASIDFRAGLAMASGVAVAFSGIGTGVGSTGNDALVADDDGKTLYGRAGNDSLTGGAGSDTLIGDGWFPSTGWGDDFLHGGAGGDYLRGGAGSDTLNGGLGNDVLDPSGEGLDGADVLIFDVAPGAGNADTIDEDFNSGSDTIVLDADAYGNIGAAGDFATGDPRFVAGAGLDSGQDASDRVIYNTTTGELWYDADGSGGGAAQLIATLEGVPALAATDITVLGASEPPPEGIVGTEGDDTLSGTGGDDTIHGLGGDDAIQAQAGNDTVLGGAGDDVFSGNAGMDWLEGGPGNDTITGGSGQDEFVFRESGTEDADVLNEFASGWDGLSFDGGVFEALGTAGAFDSGDERFHSAAGAAGGVEADDRIVYDTSTGMLYYDADGSGAGEAELVATLANGAALSASDITVV